ncbi:MAG: DJ-1/PfpI family protein [Leptothrix sp. (in: b-proteobacteria)]
MAATPATRRIGLLIYDGVELLDHAGPYEVFTTASRMHARREPLAPPPFEVCALAASGRPVQARAGLQLQPDHAIDVHPALNVLLIPGGVVDAPLADARLLAWVAAQAARSEVVASVCTGAFVLARAGVLPDGSACTTHWEDLADLRQAHPALQVLSGVRWVQATTAQGRPLYTSAGISAGIDLALHLVEVLIDRELAERTARQMDYRWIRGAHEGAAHVL